MTSRLHWIPIDPPRPSVVEQFDLHQLYVAQVTKLIVLGTQALRDIETGESRILGPKAR